MTLINKICFVMSNLNELINKIHENDKVNLISIRMNIYQTICYCRQILADIDSNNYQASKTKAILSLIRNHLERIESQVNKQ